MINNGKARLLWVFSIPILYVVISISSASQPFIPSEGYLSFLKYVAFPTSVTIFYYLAFFQQQKKTGKSRFQQRLDQTTKSVSKTEAVFIKLKNYLLGIITVPLICVTLLYVAQWYPAWPTKYLSNTEVTLRATIIKLGSIRKTGQSKIYLKDDSTGKEFSLHWNTSSNEKLHPNDNLEIIAKKHWLGLYVERFKRL